MAIRAQAHAPMREPHRPGEAPLRFRWNGNAKARDQEYSQVRIIDPGRGLLARASGMHGGAQPVLPFVLHVFRLKGGTVLFARYVDQSLQQNTSSICLHFCPCQTGAERLGAARMKAAAERQRLGDLVDNLFPEYDVNGTGVFLCRERCRDPPNALCSQADCSRPKLLSC